MASSIRAGFFDGTYDVRAALDALSVLGKVDDPVVAETVVTGVLSIGRRAVSRRERRGFARFVQREFGPMARKLPLRPGAAEHPATSELREALFALLGEFAMDPPLLSRAREQVEAWIRSPGTIPSVPSPLPLFRLAGYGANSALVGKALKSLASFYAQPPASDAASRPDSTPLLAVASMLSTVQNRDLITPFLSRTQAGRLEPLFLTRIITEGVRNPAIRTVVLAAYRRRFALLKNRLSVERFTEAAIGLHDSSGHSLCVGSFIPQLAATAGQLVGANASQGARVADLIAWARRESRHCARIRDHHRHGIRKFLSTQP